MVGTAWGSARVLQFWPGLVDAFSPLRFVFLTRLFSASQPFLSGTSRSPEGPG